MPAFNKYDYPSVDRFSALLGHTEMSQRLFGILESNRLSVKSDFDREDDKVVNRVVWCIIIKKSKARCLWLVNNRRS